MYRIPRKTHPEAMHVIPFIDAVHRQRMDVFPRTFILHDADEGRMLVNEVPGFEDWYWGAMESLGC